MKTTDATINIIETLMRNQLVLQEQVESLTDIIANLRRDLSLLQSDVRVLVDERAQVKNSK